MGLPKYANMFTLSFPTVQSNSKSNMAGRVNDWERITLTRPQCRLARAYKTTWPGYSPARSRIQEGRKKDKKVAERITLTRPQCRLARAYKTTWPGYSPARSRIQEGRKKDKKVAVTNYKMFTDSLRLWSTENVQLSVKTLSQIFPSLTLPLY